MSFDSVSPASHGSRRARALEESILIDNRASHKYRRTSQTADSRYYCAGY